MKRGYVYILTNKFHSVLYTGVTSDLKKRMYQHIHGTYDGFSKRYKVKKLIWYAECVTIKEAIEYEKVIKGWSRKRKMDLVNKYNLDWNEINIL